MQGRAVPSETRLSSLLRESKGGQTMMLWQASVRHIEGKHEKKKMGLEISRGLKVQTDLQTLIRHA